MPSVPTIPVLRIRPRHGLAALNLVEVWAYRDVLWMLTLRDIKLRYRQTALGVAWVILQPLLAGLLFAVIFGRFAKLPSEGQPYLLFVFAGIMGWNLFNGVIQRAGNSLVAESKLITKVYFPRLVIPLAGALSALVDFAVALAGVHGEQVVPFLVLVLCGGSGLALRAFGRGGVLAIAGFSLVSLAYRPAVATGVVVHSLQAEAASFLARNTDAGARVLASCPEIAVQARRRVLPGTEMGMFSVTDTLSGARAKRLGLLPRAELDRLVRAGVPDAIVLARDPSWNFSGSVPDMIIWSPPDPSGYPRWWRGTYVEAFRNGGYVVLLPRRRSGVTPVAAHEPGEWGGSLSRECARGEPSGSLPCTRMRAALRGCTKQSQ